jgi:hypothetical protein
MTQNDRIMKKWPDCHEIRKIVRDIIMMCMLAHVYAFM